MKTAPRAVWRWLTARIAPPRRITVIAWFALLVSDRPLTLILLRYHKGIDEVLQPASFALVALFGAWTAWFACRAIRAGKIRPAVMMLSLFGVLLALSLVTAS